MKLNLQYRARWKEASRSRPRGSPSSVALQVLPATTFDSDCMCSCFGCLFWVRISLWALTFCLPLNFTPPSDPSDSVSSVLTWPQALITSWFVLHDPGQLPGCLVCYDSLSPAQQEASAPCLECRGQQSEATQSGCGRATQRKGHTETERQLRTLN